MKKINKLKPSKAGQIGMVVRDINRTVKYFSHFYNIKPWFRVKFTEINTFYHGKPINLDPTIAIAFCGGVEIELIQMNNNVENLYSEILNKQGGGGHIVNTASGAGLAPMPIMTAYCCTKFAVEGFSETLRAEAAMNGIGVTSVCPGVVKTNITVTGKMFSGTAKSTPDTFFKKIDGLYVKRNYTPDRVAKKVLKGVKKNKAVIRICPETYMGDWTHSLSRTFSIYQARQLGKIFLNKM